MSVERDDHMDPHDPEKDGAELSADEEVARYVGGVIVSELADDADPLDQELGGEPTLDESERRSPAQGRSRNQQEYVQDEVQAILNSAGNYPLLTKYQEQRLAKQIANGREAKQGLVERGDPKRPDAVDEEGNRRDLTEEEAEVLNLYRREEQGERAHEKLINSNLRLVVSVAKKYRGRGVAFPDLIQEGNVGLQKSVEKFDPGRGFKFSTYATWWIRQAVQRGVADKSREIRVPVHQHEKILKASKHEIQLSTQLGREPSDEEIAESAEMETAALKETRRATNIQPTSLDKPVNTNPGEGESSHLGDIIRDPEYSEQHSLEQEVERGLELDVLNEIIRNAGLPDRDEEILKKRYGIILHPTSKSGVYTLAELGEEYDVSRERVRQIQNGAEKILRLQARKQGWDIDIE